MEQDIHNNYSRKMDLHDIEDREYLDERISAVNCLFSNLVGVEEGYLEICPEQQEPNRDEWLAWSWLINPFQGEAIQREASDKLGDLITHYHNGAMDRWWIVFTSESNE